MKKLVENTDLGIPYTTVLNKAAVKVACSLFGINKINRLYAEAEGKTGTDFTQAILQQLGISVQTDPARLGLIPKRGAFVLVANCPHGALDGLVLLETVARIRPDVKILGNFPMMQIETLSDFFLSVDEFDSTGGRTLAAVRRIVEHLKGGGPLIVFPAGEVATFRKRFSKVEEGPWSLSIAKLILQTGVPAVPAYIEGRNGLWFHLLGRVHPMLQRVRMPLELVDKRGSSVGVAFGSAASAKLLREIGRPEAVSTFLRANVRCLRSLLTDEVVVRQDPEPKPNAGRKKDRTKGTKGKTARLRTRQTQAALPIAPVDPVLLERELEAIAAERMWMRIGDLSLFCAPTYAIPLAMREIARLHETALGSSVQGGEAELMRREEYDDLYEYLFVWDAENRAIAGACRIGFGDRVLRTLGFEGFYSYSRFEFSHQLNEVLRGAIEVGAAFVAADGRRGGQTLSLLWRGILELVSRNPAYNYLVGPVSMPGGYAMAAKWLLVDYLRANHWNGDLARFVVPRNAIGTLGRPGLETEWLRGVDSVGEVDKLIRDVEPSGRGMPVLMKKYLSLGGGVMGFNIDPKRSDALDVMLILNLHA